MQGQAPTVSIIVEKIKNLLEGEFTITSIQGEISNLSPSSAGHYYFTLSDENASLSCAMFKMDALRNPLIRSLKDGDRVVLTGAISVYVKRGIFQLIAKRVYPAGVGDLKIQFERLKAKYASLGYFDAERKREIPAFPKRIAIITAIHGAALQDFLNIMYRRALWLDVLIIPAVVQGEKSAESIVKAMNIAQEQKDIEVIVLARGGGSIEDLWSFNDPLVVESIYQSKIPVISAIGHQVDFTLSDYCADLRAETPSAAAEVLSQPHTLIDKKLKELGQSLAIKQQDVLRTLEKKLERLHPRLILEKIQDKLVAHRKKLESLRIDTKLYELTRIHEHNQFVDELKTRMILSLEKNIGDKKNKLEVISKILEMTNPKNILKRGYAYISTPEGEIIKNAKNILESKEKKFVITFADGDVELTKGDI